MTNLTFGEQVKIILSRKGMTIKELAEQVELYTGKPMSRQNMTQRLGRDNFQEKDMRLIAEILGCKFQLSIMEMDPAEKPAERTVLKEEKEELQPLEREITVGELLDMTAEVEGLEKEQMQIEENAEELPAEESTESEIVMEQKEEEPVAESEERKLLRQGIRGYFKKTAPGREMVQISKEVKEEKEPILGDINPYTGKEYKTNSVRIHPKRIGYVQVYDQEQHKWTDMTEWAFLGYQERKKLLLGKDYKPPIYLD